MTKARQEPREKNQHTHTRQCRAVMGEGKEYKYEPRVMRIGPNAATPHRSLSLSYMHDFRTRERQRLKDASERKNCREREP